MGGNNGEYYGRNTTDGYAYTSQGTSREVEQILSRTCIDPLVIPKGRNLFCDAADLIALPADETGSLGSLPRIFWDKMPMVAGQIVKCNYLDNPMISVAGVGDIEIGNNGKYEEAPIQIADFCLLRQLDDWLQRIWLEGKGGGQTYESYEMHAYFYARHCEIPNARNPFCIFTGDEGFREILHKQHLDKYFGPGHEKNEDAREIFGELKRKFRDNVFLIHRSYGDSSVDRRVVAQWSETIGENHVVNLHEDRSIADVFLGILAVVSGARTLNGYLEDMVTMRDKPQTQTRIENVRRSLANIQPNPFIDTSLQWT